MKLFYRLIPYKLGKAPDAHKAELVDTKMWDLEGIKKQLTRPGSILKDTEVGIVLDRFFEQLRINMSNGEGFRHSFLTIRPVVKGLFTSEDDRYDKKRHKVEPKIMIGNPLKKACKDLKLQYKDKDMRSPIIKHVQDVYSFTIDDQITPGGMLLIKGIHLKLSDPGAGEEGVFFHHLQSNRHYEATRYYRNEPRHVEVRIPELPLGTYRLTLRGRMREHHARLGEVIFNRELQVLAPEESAEGED